MLNGILYGLICGWILALFHVDEICINVLKDFVPITLTTDHYYFVWGIIGLLSWFVQVISK